MQYELQQGFAHLRGDKRGSLPLQKQAQLLHATLSGYVSLATLHQWPSSAPQGAFFVLYHVPRPLDGSKKWIHQSGSDLVLCGRFQIWQSDPSRLYFLCIMRSSGSSSQVLWVMDICARKSKKTLPSPKKTKANHVSYTYIVKCQCQAVVGHYFLYQGALIIRRLCVLRRFLAHSRLDLIVILHLVRTRIRENQCISLAFIEVPKY